MMQPCDSDCDSDCDCDCDFGCDYACMSIETLRAETPEDFYALKEAQKLNDPDDSQLNAIHQTTVCTTRDGGAGDEQPLQLKKLKFKREIHALALEGGDVARGYCSCDEQWTNSSSPTSTTTSATISPTLTTRSANAKAGGGRDSGNSRNRNGNGNGNGNGIVKMATLKQRSSAANAAGLRLKQQHHVRFSDEKNFSD
ncbi:uncharacterized protein [Drosophila virilis]|uniref:uncharacterized protein n=1 Tax=Drosophila virilis TaxID=7244 RepID=UPI0038B341D0